MEDYFEDFDSDLNLFAEGTIFRGDLELQKMTRLNGEVYGSIVSRSQAPLIIGEEAYIKANIKAQTLVIDGFVEGNIEVTDSCRINATATVVGDIKAKRLEIKPGAIFEGRGAITSTKKAPDQTAS